MLNMAIKANASSPDDLKRKFETALAQLGNGGVPSKSSQTPIAIHKRAAMQGELGEKRAVTDAGRALAQLWNVSPTLIR